MSEEAALAEVLWSASRADEGTISATGANIVAAAVLQSDWLAQHDARVMAGALREAAWALDSDTLFPFPDGVGVGSEWEDGVIAAVDFIRSRADGMAAS